MVNKLVNMLPKQYCVRNLVYTDQILKYTEKIKELAEKHDMGRIYAVYCQTDIQELSTLLFVVEYDDNLVKFLNKLYNIIQEDFTFVDCVSMKTAMKMGLNTYLIKNNRLV